MPSFDTEEITRPRFCSKKKRWVVLLCAIAAAIVLWAEKVFRTARPINTREKVHFLQPFLHSPGFEVGFWTWNRGAEKATAVGPVLREKGKSEQDLSAAEAEVERLRAELAAERQRSALQQEKLERISKEALREEEKVARAVELDQQTTKAPSIEAPQISTALPTAETASSDSAQVEGQVRIPSSLFRQPPGLEASEAKPGEGQALPVAATETDTLNKERIVPTAEAKTEAPPAAVAEEVGKAATTEVSIPPAAQPTAVASAPVVKTDQPVITLKAGGSEIHVKISETSGVQQPVQPDTKKEESVAAAPTLRSPSEAVVDVATTTTPSRSQEQISPVVATRVEAPLASTTTPTSLASDIAPDSGTAVEQATSAEGSRGTSVEANRGTSITFNSQGQTITIEIGSGRNDKNTEITQSATSVSIGQSQSPSVPKAYAPVKSPATMQLSEHVPEPIGTPAPQALSIPSASARASPADPKSTEPPKVVSPEVATTTTSTTTTTTTSTLEITTMSTSLTVATADDRYANLALRAR